MKTITLIVDSGIGSVGYQDFLESGRFAEGLREFRVEPAHPEPTITQIKVPLDYTRTLVEMRDATSCDGYVASEVNDENFPVEPGKSGERELELVCFHREIKDDENPARSELLQELDKLGLKPEGPPELCAVGEHQPDLQREFPIVARRQVWRSPDGILVVPILDEYDYGRGLSLDDVGSRWRYSDWFLASRK
ncbi:MAG: hypothetical protein OEY44_03305 [Candidatus Peregrinibacteria bacterium]|nr:hypothetical protein [Candidatus Peregrinibacteria bacterium]